MIRIIHDDLRVFLNTRMEANGADAEMCFRITARQDLSSDATPNYFMAIPNPADTKRAAISQTSMAAMIKAGADPYRNRDVWNAQAAYRTVLRPGRWARSMSDIEDGNTLDVFTMALDAQFGVGDIAVDVLEGRAITKAYSAEAHCQCVSIGDLANSCMRYDHNQGTFSIYERAAKLATVKCPSCKGVRARALLWEVDVCTRAVGRDRRGARLSPDPCRRRALPGEPDDPLVDQVEFEDDADLRGTLAALLRGRRYEVAEAGTS